MRALFVTWPMSKSQQPDTFGKWCRCCRDQYPRLHKVYDQQHQPTWKSWILYSFTRNKVHRWYRIWKISEIFWNNGKAHHLQTALEVEWICVDIYQTQRVINSVDKSLARVLVICPNVTWWSQVSLIIWCIVVLTLTFLSFCRKPPTHTSHLAMRGWDWIFWQTPKTHLVWNGTIRRNFYGDKKSVGRKSFKQIPSKHKMWR